LDFVAEARIIGNHPESREPGFAGFVRFVGRDCGPILEASRTTAGCGFESNGYFSNAQNVNILSVEMSNGLN
jgi:hypothetical protein